MIDMTKYDINTDYPRITIGKYNDKSIDLVPPSWDCDWYWGFGYLSNRDLWTHLSVLLTHPTPKTLNQQLTDFIITDENDTWIFIELVLSIYHLRSQAEFYKRGYKGITEHNPCRKLNQNRDMYVHINTILIPAHFKALYELLSKYR